MECLTRTYTKVAALKLFHLTFSPVWVEIGFCDRVFGVRR